jgi:predicted nucleic acid-binding protein
LRCIIDANVLIDLSHGNVLPYLFKLSTQIVAPVVVLDEMIKPDREALLAMGLEQIDLTTNQFLEAARMSAADSRLSLSDCAALVAARDERITLLTGDQRLRTRAQEAGIEVRGVLWALDEIESAELLTGPALAVSLHKILEEGAWLPSDECAQRFKRWEGVK